MEPFGEGGDDAGEFPKSNKYSRNTSYGFPTKKRGFADNVRGNFAESSVGEEYEAWAEELAPDEGAVDNANSETAMDETVETDETVDLTIYNTSRWCRRLKLEGSARSRLYSFLIRIP